MLEVKQLSAARSGDQWLIGWRLTNLGEQPVQALSAWLPHSRFRGEEVDLDLTLPENGSAEFVSRVACPEEPGAVVENGFLILRLASGRVYARLRVTIGADGAPLAVCEAVT